MTPLLEKFKNDEVLLRSAIAQRIRPPLPLSPPPELKDGDLLYTSISSLTLGQGRPIRPNGIRSSCPPNPLKFERRSPTAEVIAAVPEQRSPFDSLPWPVLYAIFSNFELRDRLNAAQVCRRWRRLLTDGRFPLSELCAVNLFERAVWQKNLNKNIQTAGKVECIHLERYELLDSIFAHCTTPGVIKVWYESLDFLDLVLRKIVECNVKIHSLDAYPYSFNVGLSLVHEHLPNLRSIHMRPHASDYFFTGLDLDHFPKFDRLEYLNCDSFNLEKEATFPKNLRNLDWQSRNDFALDGFVKQVESLHNLEILTVGNANFSHLQFFDFLQSIAFWNLPRLRYLHLKLVKFDVDASLYRNSLEVLTALKVLRIELCRGVVPQVVERFLQFTSSNLRVLSISLLTDEKEFPLKTLFAMASSLRRRKLEVELSIMQTSDSNGAGREESEEEPHEPPPACSSTFADLLGKFDASFVSEEPILRSFFAAPLYANLREIKFIQCPAVDDKLLIKIAVDCPVLSLLTCITCPKVSKTGMRKFVEQFHSRRSQSLKIVWHRERAANFVGDFFADLKNLNSWICGGLNVRLHKKQFRSRQAEAVIVWSGEKTLRIQDYDSFEQARVLGFVLPFVHELQDGEVYEESF